MRVWHKDLDKEVDEEVVEVCHQDKSEDRGNNTDELDFLVAADAACHIIGDLAVKLEDESACGCDGDAAKEPRPTKAPLHSLIVAQTYACEDLKYLVK